MISFQFVPTKDDYIKAFRTFYLSNWLIWAMLIVFVLSQIICISSAFFRGDMSLNPGAVFPSALIAFSAFYLVFAFVINPLLIAGKVNRDPRLSSPVQYEVNDENIMFKNQFTETRVDWESFQKVIESKELFLLVCSANKNMFQIIPKRAFASAEDEQSFRNILNNKIPKKQESKFDIRNPIVIITIVVISLLCPILCGVAVLSYMHTAP